MADPRAFHAGQVCNYVGGMVPFFRTKQERLDAKDPRLSLEERYENSHDGYVEAVKKAAENAACKGYLLVGPEAATDGTEPPEKSWQLPRRQDRAGGVPERLEGAGRPGAREQRVRRPRREVQPRGAVA